NLNGLVMWVTDPQEVSENSGFVPVDPDFDTMTAATLDCAPFFTDWSAWGVIHVLHEAIVPGSDFAIDMVNGAPCSVDREGDFSDNLLLSTSKWGDLVQDCTTSPCGPPDGSVDVTTDVTATLDKFRNLPGATIKARCDTQPATPDLIVNIEEISRLINAFRGLPYPFPAIDPRPCS
ncbi:MAG: hypothetical protein IID35_05325, partial [Planctomycetes bacterium]|nr:hypothetical protein [Planctomycetota bacterium]